MSNARVRAGQLRNRVIIQSSTSADDAFGEAVLTWSNDATVWAEVETAGGAEALSSGAERTSASVVFTMRHRTLDADKRISWDGGTYDIEVIENVAGRNKLLRVTGVARG